MSWRGGLLLVALISGCASEERPVIELPGRDACYGRERGRLCSAGVALICEQGRIAERDDCTARSLVCADGLGCRVCDPGTTSCDGNRRFRCNTSGTALELVAECADGLSCSPAGCRDLCADAAAESSYLGCDYWPVFTVNSQLDPLFRPAISIGNGNLVAAQIVIERAGAMVTELEVPARSATTVELAFDPALSEAGASRLLRQGAYHLRASVPVTVHQFNPLLFQVQEPCQRPEPGEVELPNVCHSYSNDASLLLPSSALGPDASAGEARVTYLAASRPSFMARATESGVYDGVPGFVAVVAVGDRPVHVRLTSRAYTLPAAAGDAEPIDALAPGGSLERTLAPGDVLQLLTVVPERCEGTVSGNFCDPGANFDLTGTEISADGAIQVISGHDCTYVPFDRPACDHLEEALIPLRTWGTSAVVARPLASTDAGYVLRVISGADANTVSFEPAVHAPVELARGQTFELSAHEPLFVRGTGRLQLVQYLVGQNAGQRKSSAGDPSMALVVPIDQYRQSYNFVSPATYTSNYVDLVAVSGDRVTLDGRILTGFTPVGASGYSVLTVELERSGAHELRGTNAAGVGVLLYGLARYTSYMLPGGLDLQPVQTPGI